MPKRVIDGEGIWGSTKIARCPEWMRAEYAWLYPLADAYGCFELTSLAVIRGKVAPHRPKLTENRLAQIFVEFEKQGLLFIWDQNERRYAYWTGSDRKGRLPRPSRRAENYEKVHSPPVPRNKLRLYLQGFGDSVSRRVSDASPSSASASASASVKANASASVPTDTAQASPSLDGFDDFWSGYPNRVGKPAAKKAWKKIKRSEIFALVAGTIRWKNSEQWQNPQFIPYPATFLNRRQWEDEPPASGAKNRAKQRTERNLRNLGLAE